MGTKFQPTLWKILQNHHNGNTFSLTLDSALVSTMEVHHLQLSPLEDLVLELIECVIAFLGPIDWGRLAQISKTMGKRVVPIAEHLIKSYLPSHLLMSPTLKTITEQHDPWTIDEFGINKTMSLDKPWNSTYRIPQTTITTSIPKWGSNMNVYIHLVTMDVSGLWRVTGTYTDGRRYNYIMKLQQVGSRRGDSRLEVFVEGEVRCNNTDVMVIGGKIDGNMAVLHEIMLGRTQIVGSHLANVVSAIISDNGDFMSGTWLQHENPLHMPQQHYDEETHALLLDSDSTGELQEHHYHYPLRVLCSGIFRAIKESDKERLTAPVATESPYNSWP